MNQKTTISAEELCSLSGLSDRRHRQLATAGFFPPPRRGIYQFQEAISGLFRHFREMSAGQKKETVEARLKKLRLESEILVVRRDRETRQLVPRDAISTGILRTATAQKS